MIDWNVFKSKYFRAEIGGQYRLTLRNWRQDIKKFEGEEKPVLIFDIVKINDELLEDPLVFSTSSLKLIRQFRPYVERAEIEGRGLLNVILMRPAQKEYLLVDQDLVRKAVHA